ncbi:MAG: hypothetical protein ABJC05_06250 [Pyrinomonadaceae bacterium]
MKQPFLCTIVAAVASLLFIRSEALAQQNVPRFERQTKLTAVVVFLAVVCAAGAVWTAYW